MSDALLTIVEILLIPAGLLPCVTAWVLRRYRASNSQALRDRYQVAIVLALLGATTSVITILVLLGIRIGLGWIVFGLVILAVDVVSGKWLLDYWTGRFADRPDGAPETPLEREDRQAGEFRRRLQARREDEEAS